MKRGLIQVYTGNGKGKTTAATGLIVRALGHGMNVLLARFLKPNRPVSGEIRFLTGSKNLTILSADIGVFDHHSPQEISHSVFKTFDAAIQMLNEGFFDLVVFDELNGALAAGYLPIDNVMTFIEQRPDGLEVVFTGRDAPQELCGRADLISQIDAVRHPYDQQISARKGIEF